MNGSVLEVRNLKVGFGRKGDIQEVVHGISFSVNRGEVLAIVGESGSGKSVTAMSLMGLLPRGHGHVLGGSATFEGKDLFALNATQLQEVRGRQIGMVFQEPMTSLNPVVNIGVQMTEGLVAHGICSQSEANARAAAMLERVGIADAKQRLKQYPHEFSGGMRQRVMVAMAMLLKPSLLIADEPTTALDVTIQAQILDLLKGLIAETGTSLILITHDMGVVAEIADRVLVMQHGHLVETATPNDLYNAPTHPYSRALLDAVPRLDKPTESARRIVAWAQPILCIDDIHKSFGGRKTLFGSTKQTHALNGVSLDIMTGEAVALVGESGSGKSTIGRAVARLIDVDQGRILVDGTDISSLAGQALRRARAKAQMIFQDPYSSLDPRFTVGQTIAEPILIHGKVSRQEASDEAAALLEKVGLSADMADRLPHEFSGGQRQRIAIARALATRPSILVADEPTSALDVSVQAQVLDLLAKLRSEDNLALLFISHDLAVVRQISNRIAVMRAGRIVEIGETDTVLVQPRHAYTKALLSASPTPDPAQRGRQRITSPDIGYANGPLTQVAQGHWVAS